MASIRHGVSLGLLALAPLLAQELKLPPGLGAHATQTVEVTLDSNTLQLAAKFLSDSNSDEAGAKKLIAGLKSIVVRSFEFEKAGQYSPADVKAVRAQFSGPTWTRIAVVESKNGDNAEVYMKGQNGRFGGMAIISAEPNGLTIALITGDIDPDKISGLGGKFGIPKIDVGKKKKDGKED